MDGREKNAGWTAAGRNKAQVSNNICVFFLFSFVQVAEGKGSNAEREGGLGRQTDREKGTDLIAMEKLDSLDAG